MVSKAECDEYKQSQVDFNRKKTTHIYQITLQQQLHYSHSNIALIAADIAYTGPPREG